MAITRRLLGETLELYFDTFSKRFLRHESTDVVDIEILTDTLGNHLVAEGAHLTGITYDRYTNGLDIALDGGQHRAYQPKEVWTLEEETNGFIRAIEVVRDDDTREVVRVRRLGVRRLD